MASLMVPPPERDGTRYPHGQGGVLGWWGGGGRELAAPSRRAGSLSRLYLCLE